MRTQTVFKNQEVGVITEAILMQYPDLKFKAADRDGDVVVDSEGEIVFNEVMQNLGRARQQRQDRQDAMSKAREKLAATGMTRDQILADILIRLEKLEIVRLTPRLTAT